MDYVSTKSDLGSFTNDKNLYCAFEDGYIFEISIKSNSRVLSDNLEELSCTKIYENSLRIDDKYNRSCDFGFCQVQCYNNKKSKKNTYDLGNTISCILPLKDKSLIVADSRCRVRRISFGKQGKVIKNFNQFSRTETIFLKTDEEENYLFTVSKDGIVRKIS